MDNHFPQCVGEVIAVMRLFPARVQVIVPGPSVAAYSGIDS